MFQLFEVLTSSALFNFLCRYREDTEDFHHDFHHDIHHFRRRWHLGVCFKMSDEILDMFKDIDEIVVTCANILGRLGCVGVTIIRVKARSMNAHQKEDTESRKDHFPR